LFQLKVTNLHGTGLKVYSRVWPKDVGIIFYTSVKMKRKYLRFFLCLFSNVPLATLAPRNSRFSHACAVGRKISWYVNQLSHIIYETWEIYHNQWALLPVRNQIECFVHHFLHTRQYGTKPNTTAS